MKDLSTALPNGKERFIPVITLKSPETEELEELGDEYLRQLVTYLDSLPDEEARETYIRQLSEDLDRLTQALDDLKRSFDD